jgi:pimeloyl-ACP methyl ester carboxylesterase
VAGLIFLSFYRSSMKKHLNAALFALPIFALASVVNLDLDWNRCSLAIGRVAHANITVTKARIGCLDIQHDGNLTGLAGRACNGKMTCAYKAPTPQQYQAAGVRAKTRTFCTQAMEIIYKCGTGEFHTVTVPGDAWGRPPAQLACQPPAPPKPANHGHHGGGKTDVINVRSARIGCLDIQPLGNLTKLVAPACNGKKSCSYKAPTPQQYQAAGVKAAERMFCTQAMEINYDCGRNDPRSVTVPGDAWNHGPAHLACDGGTLATNHARIDNLPDEPCESGWPSQYTLAPADMLDWTPLEADTFPILNHPPPPATRAQYNTTGNRVGAPGSTIGSNEGRLHAYLRMIAQKKDPTFALCESAKAFGGVSTGATVGALPLPRPTGQAWGNAMADLAVTGSEGFARFRNQKPTLDSVRSACAGASDANINRALDRAYAVANAIRVRGTAPHPSPERRALGWIAVSGEDDRPYRPVNVPTASFPQFTAEVDVKGLAGTLQNITTRYMIAHARPPKFKESGPLVAAGNRKVEGDLEPAIAKDAHVILFIHGMDSRVEEALNLTRALHKLAEAPGGKNWTVISLDLPSSGYTDSVDHNVFGRAGDITCHNTPLVDFLENYIVRFVDTVDRQVGGDLKPRIRAIVGGSLGGNMSLRLGRRNFLPGAQRADWIRNVVPWSPASIWPPMTNRPGVSAGCDQSWTPKYDIIIGWPRGMADVNERPNDRRNLFYAGFDYAPPGDRPQAQHWWRNDWACKARNIIGARIDRHETYGPLFRKWHWRLATEQLAFSHRQNQGSNATRGALADPLFLYNKTRTLMFAGVEDVGGDLGLWAERTAPLMKNTPGMFRYLGHTGHSLDDERPAFVAREIVNFLASGPRAP